MSRISASLMPSHKSRGFTMIELMVVIAIVAVLGALAVPSFTPILERWRARDATENLQSAMYVARSEAMKRSGNIVITRTASAGACTSSGNADWSCGWRIEHIAGGVTTPIQENRVPPNTVVTLAGSVGSLTLDRWGVIRSDGVAAGLSFDIYPKGKSVTDSAGAKVCIESAGRIKAIKGTTSC